MARRLKVSEKTLALRKVPLFALCSDKELEQLAGLATEVEVHAELLGPGWVEGVFGVDESGHAARLLSLGNSVQRDCRFTAGFWSENFDDTAAGQALAAEGDVQRNAAGRNTANWFH